LSSSRNNLKAWHAQPPDEDGFFSARRKASMSDALRTDIRNVAIIAHVDHGKTTLVDGLLKQSNTFRKNEQVGTLILDRGELERERGITILAKNTAVSYNGIKINIIDTPGHADFGGEVERVLNMADGCLLLVDAVEGPMPQTRFVLRKAFEIGLKPILVINKIDRPSARPAEVLNLTQDLFLELATDAEQLDFPILYANAKEGWASFDASERGEDLQPLFETILRYVPAPVGDVAAPLQLLVTTLDYDDYRGKIAIGRIFRGSIAPGDAVLRLDRHGNATRQRINQVFTHLGLGRQETDRADAGEIVALTGVEDAGIGDTIASVENPEALPPIAVDEPTVKMTFGVNTSPFAGRDGRFVTSRQIRERLMKELETNVSLRVEDTDSAETLLVSGRGELHLSILIETMRREGYEFAVSRPEAITKLVNDQLMEPVEHLVIDTREDYIGFLTESLSKRLGQMINLQADAQGNVRVEYSIPTRGLIGFRNSFLTATRGEGIMSSLLIGYEPWRGELIAERSGALVVAEDGIATTYGLQNAQERGTTCIEPTTPVYEGMIFGLHARDNDLTVNVAKTKMLGNYRASVKQIDERLEPALRLSLEALLDMLQPDELLEVTPKNLRLRKRLLKAHERARAGKRPAAVSPQLSAVR
jgi:GTP-binding protein